MKIERDSSGRIIGWICDSCKLYNDLLRFTCHYTPCQTHRPKELDNLARVVVFLRQGCHVHMRLSEEEFKELHKRFFNEEITFLTVNEMSIQQLEAHIEELELIAVEAKVKIQAAQETKRTRTAKLREQQRDSDGNFSAADFSDSIAARQRQARDKTTKAKRGTAKLEALLKTYEELGITGAALDEVKNKLRQADDSPVLATGKADIPEGLKFKGNSELEANAPKPKPTKPLSAIEKMADAIIKAEAEAKAKETKQTEPKAEPKAEETNTNEQSKSVPSFLTRFRKTG